MNKLLILLLAVILTACGTKKSITTSSGIAHAKNRTGNETVNKVSLTEKTTANDTTTTTTTTTTTYFSQPTADGQQYITSQTVTTTHTRNGVAVYQTKTSDSQNQIKTTDDTTLHITHDKTTTTATTETQTPRHIANILLYLLIFSFLILILKYRKAISFTLKKLYRSCTHLFN